MEFVSINPYNEKQSGAFPTLSDAELMDKVAQSWRGFKTWRKVKLPERCRLVSRLANELEVNRDAYAHSITIEMGKPIVEARLEITKCAALARYYADHAQAFLKTKEIHTESKASYIQYDPLGVVLGIMPWNYPFWQVLRFAIPTMLAGNAVLVKHAPTVPLCSLAVEEAFLRVGFPKHAFTQLFASVEQTGNLIDHDAIRAVSLTGSEAAGRKVASRAGAALKKCVLELGGSNALLVRPDADFGLAVKLAVKGRFSNAGQSCIAAKRIIIPEEWKDRFVDAMISEAEKLVVGDPLNEITQIGPMARLDLAEHLESQMKKSVKMGAMIVFGGKRKNCLFTPTILTDVVPGMPAFDEETFGPLACITTYKTPEEGIKLAKKTKYGLGVAIVTANVAEARQLAKKFEDGSVFINQWVKSDPRLPFGGQKASGYGRELSKEGIREFVNIKCIRA
ncbi:MAG: NAD-dependent succinate-semialdehyde dehydrogenase [Cryomorphaceae bacterium]|nr:NAD-dependent succinate-semialdehyde dehydrogenase [Cryomorphaceae bacterium]